MKTQRNRQLRSGLGLALMSVIAVAILFPLMIMIFTAFKTSGEVSTNPIGPPRNWTAASFDRAWNDARMGRLMVNSLIVSIGAVSATVALSSLGGFALGRLHLRRPRLVMFLLIVGLVLPFEILMVPIFYTFRELGLLNSYVSMILPQTALALPFGILLIGGFVRDLPKEIFDSAELDGASLWRQYRHFALPLAKPALIALAVLELIWSWNQYLVPLVMVQDSNLRTIPLGLSFFVGRFQSDFPALAAAATIALLPSLVLYALFHRHALRANLAGALD